MTRRQRPDWRHSGKVHPKRLCPGAAFRSRWSRGLRPYATDPLAVTTLYPTKQISTGYTGLVFLDFEQDDNIWSPPQNPARTEELRRKRARFASKLIPAQSR